MISQFADIFVQMVVLFAVGATGYAAKRLNLMDEDFDKKFSKLILNTALPALILASVLTAETLPSVTIAALLLHRSTLHCYSAPWQTATP